MLKLHASYGKLQISSEEHERRLDVIRQADKGELGVLMQDGYGARDFGLQLNAADLFQKIYGLRTSRDKLESLRPDIAGLVLEAYGYSRDDVQQIG